MRGAIPPLPQYDFMTWCLDKHSDNFTFYILILSYHLRLGPPYGVIFSRFPFYGEEVLVPNPASKLQDNPIIATAIVCVCVCVRERERRRQLKRYVKYRHVIKLVKYFGPPCKWQAG
jgi:hypothetical protein